MDEATTRKAARDPRAGERTDAHPGPPAADPAVETLTFDAAMGQLGEVVARLEAGGLPLEESIVLYERGVALHARCARLLDDAELRIQRLVEGPGGSLRAVEMPTDDPDDQAAARG